jgi:hypothetical protein
MIHKHPVGARGPAVMAAVMTLTAPAVARSQQIRMGPIVQVSPSGTGHHWFTSIAAAPDDSLHLMACGIRQPSRQNTWQGFLYLSDDRGRTWRVGMVDSTGINVSEETCAFGPRGRAYFIAQPWSREMDEGRSVLHFYRSGDGGNTWLGPTTDQWLDYARMAVDNSDGPYGGRIYAVGNKGRKDGLAGKEVFSSPDGYLLGPRVVVPAAREYRTHSNFPQQARVLGDGSVIAAYWSRLYPSNGDTTEAKLQFGIEIIRSTDGGQSFEQPVLAARAASHQDVAPTFDSYDGPEGTVLVLAWSDSAGGRPRAHLASSFDGGKSWTHPMLVDDAPARPSDLSRGRDADRASVAVTRDGVIGLTWVEQQGDCWRFSASVDSGRSFLPSVPLNRCPRRPPAEANAYGDYLWAVPFIDIDSAPGMDTARTGITVRYWESARTWSAGIAADAGGAFHPAWVLPRDYGRLWTTTVRVTRQQTSPPKPTLASLADVSSRVAFTISDLQYDYAGGTLRLSLSLFNKDSVALKGPIIVSSGAISSRLGTVAVLEPDGVEDGHPLWSFSSSLRGGLLRPHEESGPRQLTLSITRIPVEKRPGLDWKNLWRHRFTIELKVYAPVFDTSSRAR